MAQTKKSVSEFIQDAFCPTIAVLCSYDAESICRKNNLTFAELIQPFCRLPSEGKTSMFIESFLISHSVNYRDPTNNLIILKNLRLEIKDFNSQPPQNTLAKKLLNDSVANALTNGNVNQERAIDTEQYQLHIRSKRSSSIHIVVYSFSFEMSSDNTLVRCLARLFLSHRLRGRS